MGLFATTIFSATQRRFECMLHGAIFRVTGASNSLGWCYNKHVTQKNRQDRLRTHVTRRQLLAQLCYAKSRRCKSSLVTSPYWPNSNH